MDKQYGIIELFREAKKVGFYDRFLSFIENIDIVENNDNDNNNNDKYVENLVLSFCKKNDILGLFRKTLNLLIHEMASKIENCRSYKYPLKLDINIFASYLFENNIDDLPFEIAKTFFEFINEIVSDINGETRFENNLFMCKQITVIIVDIFKLLDEQSNKLNNLIKELYGDNDVNVENPDKEFIKRFYDFLKTLDENDSNNDVFESLYTKYNHFDSFHNILKLVVDDISSQIKVSRDSNIPIILNFHKYTGAFDNDIVPENFPVAFFEFIEEIVQKVNEKTSFQENFDACGKISILIGSMTNIVLSQRDAIMELINKIT
jgi:hypothetical protein